MSMTCITPGCKKPVHKHGFRFCSGCAIEMLQQQLKHAETRINGLPLRDYFAGQALAGILADGFADTVPHDDVGGGRDAAFFAYQYADAMIAARKEQPHD